MFTTLVGIFSALFAGVLNGSFATPMKRMSKWEWENIWLMWAFWALLVIPWLLAFFAVPGLINLYYEIPAGVLLKTFLFGAGWGIGAVTFGLGMYMVGLSLGFSIIVGITAVTGSLIPMLIFSRETIFTLSGMVIILGLLFAVIGVGFCGHAGVIREKSFQKKQDKSTNFKIGFLVCLVSGIFSAMLNMAFVFGKPIADTARNYIGNSGTDFIANTPIWSLALLGAFVTNLLYCGILLLRRGTWRKYGESGTKKYWFRTMLMGILWMSGISLYGVGASSLGKVGAVVAWIILMAVTVIVGNIWGFLSGEWKDTPRNARLRMMQGLSFLIISIFFVSLGQYMS
ncbi:hypothetical protein KAS50_09315 [bacterium]|nr:hypothetical protein [bacterium]